jgi:hypothetical protein
VRHYITKKKTIRTEKKKKTAAKTLEPSSEIDERIAAREKSSKNLDKTR